MDAGICCICIPRDATRAISISQSACGWGGECSKRGGCCESIKLWFGSGLPPQLTNERTPIQFNVHMVDVCPRLVAVFCCIPKGIRDPSIKNKFHILLSPYFFLCGRDMILLCVEASHPYYDYSPSILDTMIQSPYWVGSEFISLGRAQ